MKAILVSLLLSWFCIAASADSFQTFSSIVDFNASLKSLSDNQESINTNKLYILEGTITAIHRIKSPDDKFIVELDIINSEWVDFSTIKSYHATLRLEKKEFSVLFPQNPNQKPGPGQIGTNSKVLVLVNFLRINTDNKDAPSLIFQTHDIKLIK